MLPPDGQAQESGTHPHTPLFASPASAGHHLTGVHCTYWIVCFLPVKTGWGPKKTEQCSVLSSISTALREPDHSKVLTNPCGKANCKLVVFKGQQKPSSAFTKPDNGIRESATGTETHGWVGIFLKRLERNVSRSKSRAKVRSNAADYWTSMGIERRTQGLLSVLSRFRKN